MKLTDLVQMLQHESMQAQQVVDDLATNQLPAQAAYELGRLQHIGATIARLARQGLNQIFEEQSPAPANKKPR